MTTRFFVEAFGVTSRMVERDGRRCIRGGIFGFDVVDEFAFDIDESVTLELVFDRTETGGFMVSYDHASLAFPDRDYDLPVGGDRWVAIEVVLDRSRFANRTYHQTDLVMAATHACQQAFPPTYRRPPVNG